MRGGPESDEPAGNGGAILATSSPPARGPVGESPALRAFEDGDLEPTVDLCRLVFTHAYGPAVGDRVAEGFRKRFRWQFRDFPVPGARARNLVLDGGTGPIAHLARYPLRFRAGGRDGVAAMTCDFFVHPGQRGRGTALFEEMCRDAPFVLHLGGAPAVTRIAEKLGFRLVGHMETWIRPASPARVGALLAELGFRRLPAAFACDLADAVRLLVAAFSKAPRAAEGIRVAPTEAVGQEFDDLARRAAGTESVGFLKDAAYVDWRYLREPVDRYRLLAARSGDGRLLGYAAGKAQPGTGPRPFWKLLDLVAESEAPHVRAALVAAAVEEASRAGAVALRWTGLDPAVSATLARSGFVRIARHSPVVMARGTGPFDPRDLFDPARWRLHHGDTHGSYAE